MYNECITEWCSQTCSFAIAIGRSPKGLLRRDGGVFALEPSHVICRILAQRACSCSRKQRQQHNKGSVKHSCLVSKTVNKLVRLDQKNSRPKITCHAKISPSYLYQPPCDSGGHHLKITNGFTSGAWPALGPRHHFIVGIAGNIQKPIEVPWNREYPQIIHW